MSNRTFFSLNLHMKYGSLNYLHIFCYISLHNSCTHVSKVHRCRSLFIPPSSIAYTMAITFSIFSGNLSCIHIFSRDLEKLVKAILCPIMFLFFTHAANTEPQITKVLDCFSKKFYFESILITFGMMISFLFQFLT